MFDICYLMADCHVDARCPKRLFALFNWGVLRIPVSGWWTPHASALTFTCSSFRFFLRHKYWTNRKEWAPKLYLLLSSSHFFFIYWIFVPNSQEPPLSMYKEKTYLIRKYFWNRSHCRSYHPLSLLLELDSYKNVFFLFLHVLLNKFSIYLLCLCVRSAEDNAMRCDHFWAEHRTLCVQSCRVSNCKSQFDNIPRWDFSFTALFGCVFFRVTTTEVYWIQISELMSAVSKS